MAFKQISAYHKILTDGADFTYLTADVASAGSTLTVQSIVGLAINKILLIGEFGAEDSEIIKTHASTAPTGTTVTLASNLVFSHPQDTKVYVIDYDQVEFNRVATSAGTKTVMATLSIEADKEYTDYKDSTYTSGYYFTRFKDSINTTYSDYSDPIPYAGYSDNMVYSIKKRALESVGESIGDLITDEFLNEKLYEGRRDIYESLKRWSHYQKYDTDIGNVDTGDYRVAVPTDLADKYTDKNIYKLRIGQEQPFDFITKAEMDEYWIGTAKTTLASDYAVVDATVTLTDSRDFEDSGTITIDEDTVKYSANNRSTGVLTVSTAGSSAHTAADNAYQGVSFGLPDKACIYEEYISFNCPVASDYINRNYWMDYYSTITAVDSDADEIPEKEYDMLTNYLAFNIKKKKNRGEISPQDYDYLEYTRKKNEFIRKEILNRPLVIRPNISLNDGEI